MKFHLVPQGLSPTWPFHPLEGEASFGVTHGPPLHLLSVLETRLGRTGKVLDPAMRAAALVPCVRNAGGFFEASARADPLGVAEEMLRWRDVLWMEGWRAEPITPRLADLAAVTVEVEPGVPDRLLAVLAALGERRAGIRELILAEELTTLPWLWREVVTALQKQGTELVFRAPAPGGGDSDLHRMRRAEALRGGRSIQLVRAPAPRIAADAVASWLVAQDDWRNTVIIGADRLLEHALRRHGLPVLGEVESGDQPVIRTLRLALALGWGPSDPQRAFELLTLRGGPVPPSVAEHLLSALQAWPAVGSDQWRAAFDKGLRSVEDPERRRRVAGLVSVLFEAHGGARYPVSLACKKAQAVDRWARAIAARGSEASPRTYATAAAIAARFLSLLATTERTDLTPPELEQLLRPAEAAAQPPPVWPAEVGLASVRQPGALLGRASRVVWWSFSRESIPAARLEIPLAAFEVRALEERGIRLRAATEQAKLESIRWRRPLEQTEDALLFVCPRLGDDGEPLHPHPLWDEVASKAPKDVLASMIVEAPTSGRAVPMTPRRALPGVSPRRRWDVASGLVRSRPGPESPNSLQTLLQCTFAYSLRYGAEIRRSHITSLPAHARLIGSLAHHVMGQALAVSAGKKPHEVARDVVERFDDQGPRLAALLFRSGADAERSVVRSVIEHATLVLAELIRERGLEVLGSEMTGEGDVVGRQIRGTADLLLGHRASGTVIAVVDLKWGSERRHRESIEAGVAVQLASYAHIFAREDAMPDVAYFILKGHKLIAAHPSRWSEGGPGAPVEADTWRAFSDSIGDAFEWLDAGKLEAPGNPDENGNVIERSERVEQRIILAPQCRFCDLAGLCGRAFSETHG